MINESSTFASQLQNADSVTKGKIHDQLICIFHLSTEVQLMLLCVIVGGSACLIGQNNRNFILLLVTGNPNLGLSASQVTHFWGLKLVC